MGKTVPASLFLIGSFLRFLWRRWQTAPTQDFVFSFGTGKEQKIYIGSADMMTRNTEKRVEVACPVLDGQIRRQINHDLKIMLSDNVKARIMQKDGTYMKRTGGIKAVDSQAVFMEEALKTAEEDQRGRGLLAFFLSLRHRKK